MKMLPGTIYDAPTGGLGLIAPTQVVWYKCREQFQINFAGGNFAFNCRTGTKEHVIAFLDTFQQAANVPVESWCRFFPTNWTSVLLVQPGAWWSYRLRLSLLTALLRCGQSYTERNGAAFEKALYSQTYTSRTRYAIERFLSGYTAVRWKKETTFPGWQDFFSSRTPMQVDDFLVKQRRKKQEEQQA